MKKQIEFDDIPFPDTADLERQLLADLVSSTDMIGDILPLVHSDFFSNKIRRAIWDTIVGLYNHGKAIDATTLTAICGKGFVKEILPKFGTVGATIGILEHAQLLRTGAARRRAYLAAANFLTDAMSPKNTESDILASIEAFANHVAGPAPLQAEVKLSGALKRVREDLRQIEALKVQGKSLRVRTGFHYLDDTLNGGLKAGQLIVLAARPSVGKTAVMLQWAMNAAQQGHPVEIFSMEMTSSELCERLLFSTGKVTPYQVSFAEMEWADYAEAERKLTHLPLYINDFSRSLDEIVSRLTMAVKQGRCDIAFIDYLGLFTEALNPGVMTKLYQVIAKITGTLKAVAKRLEIPIVLLCQINRAQARERRAPELFDLRDSGSIEQDSDIVIMLEPRPDERRIYAWLRKNRCGKRDMAFVLVPNSSYSVFEEGQPLCLLSPPAGDVISSPYDYIEVVKEDGDMPE